MNTTHRPTEYRPITQPEVWTGYSPALKSNVIIPNTIHCDRCDREALVEFGYVGEDTFLSRYCERHDPITGR